MKVFVTGISGQVGAKLATEAASNGFEVFGGHMSRPWLGGPKASVLFDKTDRDAVLKTISEIRPDVVIDTGALHNVDYCETHPKEAMAVNATGTLNLVHACEATGSRLVFVSTDFVFGGTNAPYDEDSTPEPLSYYAQSKLQGERYALSVTRNVVVRPSVIYSWIPASGMPLTSTSGKPMNFAAWLVSQLSAKKSVEIVDDQIASPTLADDLARAILAIVRSRKSGLFHTAGRTPLSRYSFSVEVARKLGLDENLIRPIASAKLNQVARRPSNSSLISDKIRREVGCSMMPLGDALNLFERQATSGQTP